MNLPGVHAVTSKGHTYYYAWRGGPRMEADPAEPVKFALEYAKHHEAKGGNAREGTVSALVTDCLKSPEWKRLADRTAGDWRPWMDKIREHFGPLKVAAFKRPEIKGAIKKWRDQWTANPRTADVALEVLSWVMSFAVDRGDLMVNPVFGIKRLHKSARSEVIWTDEDISALEAAASPEIVQAAKLALLTGLRRGDLLSLSWASVGALAIDIKTGKSRGRNRALIPLYKELRQYLATIKKRSPHYVLVNSRGLPWRSGFDASWQKAIQSAGVKKHFHDLRGTAATKLFRAGFAAQEIAETMGWRVGRVEHLIDLYVKRDEILLDRIRRVDALDQNAE